MRTLSATTCEGIPNAWPAARRRSLGRTRGGWVILDQAAVSLASFLTTAMVGRLCGPEEMGIYGLAVSIFWLVAAVPNSLVWTPYTSRAAKLPIKRRAVYAGSATIHAVLLSLPIAAVLLVLGLAPLPIGRSNFWFGPMCLALVPFVISMTFREHLRRINLANLRMRDLLAVDGPVILLQMTLLLGLAYFGRLSATSALLAVAAASALATVWLWRERDQFQFQTRSAWTHWAYNQQFGGWVLLVSLAWLIGDTAYRWLVGWLHGIETLGEFTAAQSIVLAVNPLLLSVGNLTRATAARSYASGGMIELRRQAVRGTLLMGIGAGVAFTALAYVGGPAVQTIFGDQFAGQGAVVAALCLGMFVHSLLIPVDAALAALQLGRAMLAAAMTRMVVLIAAGVPLIWWRGAEGVGYAIALGCGAAAVVQCLALARVGPEGARR